MKSFYSFCAATLAFCGFSVACASAQVLFSFEPGEPGLPYAGNPALYQTTLSTTTGVTHGTTSLQTSVAVPTFGGPGSAAFTDAARANAINGASALLIDMTVPNKVFGFGNIDMQFFQTGIRPGGDADETAFSGSFAGSPGQTITLTIPLTNTQFGTPHININPALPWSYQIDLSFNSAAGGPYVFQFDNIRVVPEPVSLGAVGTASGLMLMRRRRHA